MIFTDVILLVIGIAIIFNYTFYPLILKVVSQFVPKFNNSNQDFKPEITVIIAAYNEEELIADAIDSVFEGDYPKDKIRVIVGSDGSTDRTNQILSELSTKYPSLSFHCFGRGGKNNTLNKIIPLAKTEIIVMMDADIRLNENALSIIISHFADQKVGGVIATQNIENEKNENSGSAGVLIYQQYENFLKYYESAIDSCVNAFGYFYAIRSKFFKPIASDLLCDDMFTIYTVLENKSKVKFAPEAMVNEVREKSLENEKHRRLRASAGGMATVFHFRHLLNIFEYGWVSFFIWSHKVTRWTTPYLMILLILLTIMMNSGTITFQVILVTQLVLYVGALLGFLVEKAKINFSVFRPFLFFVVINYAILLGSFRFLKGAQNAIWDRQGFSSS